MAVQITRHFVTIGNRQMMYRSAGHGPPVLLLHQSPKTSAEHLPLIGMLAEEFTVLAPDTPGFGLSDPLDADPDTTPIDRFAEAMVEFLDALGVEKVGLYGIHTGAAIATRLTRLFPDRVHCLIANGTLVLTDDERAEMLAYYFVPFRVQWDGSHLTWLWARLREQIIFFPWYRKDPASRLNYSAPSTARLHQDSLDLLNAGDAYRTAYRGAIAYDKAADMAHVAPPTMYICSETDVLMQYAHRFPELPPKSRFVPVPTPEDIFSKTVEIFREFVPSSPAPALPEATALHDELASRFVRTAGGDLRVRFSHSGDGLPVLLLHELGASGASVSPWAKALIGNRPLIVPDMPGHGDSESEGSVSTLDDITGPICEMVEGSGEPIEIWAIGDSAAIGTELCRKLAGRVKRLVLCDPFIATDHEAARYVPDLTPSYEGAHLLRAWMSARDRCLFWPWPDTSHDGIVRQAPIINNEAVHQRAVDLLKSGPALPDLMRAVFASDVLAAIRNSETPCTALASPWLAIHPPFLRSCETAGLTLTKLTGPADNWLDQS